MNVFIIRNLDPIDDLTISMVPNRLLSRLQLGWGGVISGLPVFYQAFQFIITPLFTNLEKLFLEFSKICLIHAVLSLISTFFSAFSMAPHLS